MHVHGNGENGAIDVNIQDQYTDRISLFLAQSLGEVIAVSGASKDAITFSITTDGVVPAIGNFICMQEDEKITQVLITAVVADGGNDYTISIAVPLDYEYDNNAGCFIQNCDMDVDGSITDQAFMVQPKAGTKWDITRMMVAMVLGTAGDDGKFGNLTALTSGQYFRKEDGVSSQNLFSAVDNSDFRIEGYDVSYPTRSGGLGNYAMAARISFGGQDKSGVVIRLDGDKGESFKSVIRDNLTGLIKYRVKVQGHVVLD